jgi:hypothetical protein
MKPPTFDEVAAQMRTTAASQLFEVTGWAIDQGQAIVPHLSKLLTMVAADTKRAIDGGEPLVNYPFNILWSLSQIGGSGARAALARHATRAQDPGNRQLARHALAGLDLRAKMRRKDVGVLHYASTPLLAKPSHEARKLRELRAGQGLRINKNVIENEKETGARGGPTRFCEVELIPGGQRGYLELEGEGFPLWF